MKREQFILLKLAEECAEVAQRAIKQMQFGAHQIQKAGEVEGGSGAPAKEAGLTNGQRLDKELVDLLVMADLLRVAGQIPTTTVIEFEVARAAKIAKLNKYIAFSRLKGELDGDWTI